MPRISAKGQQNAAASCQTTTIESALGVNGSLRVRPYGNVKNAHLVLKKVDEAVYEDERGVKRTRAVFSLFAHKLINVKAGKELFLYLHPANGDLQECSIAFEADLLGENEDLDNKLAEEGGRKPEETVVRKDQTLPPKMRKAWVKKHSVTPTVTPTPTIDLPATPLEDTSLVRTKAPSCDFGSQTFTVSRVDVACQTIKETGPLPRSYAEAEVQTDDFPLLLPDHHPLSHIHKISAIVDDSGTEEGSVPASCTSTTLTTYSLNARSLSPMEIDSTASTPCHSPIYAPKATTNGISVVCKEEEPDLLILDPGTVEVARQAPNDATLATQSPSRIPSPEPSTHSPSPSVMSISSDEYEPPPPTPFDVPLVFKPSQSKPATITLNGSHMAPTNVTRSASQATAVVKSIRNLKAPTFVPARLTSCDTLRDYSEASTQLSCLANAEHPRKSNELVGMPLTAEQTGPSLPRVNAVPSSSKITLDEPVADSQHSNAIRSNLPSSVSNGRKRPFSPLPSTPPLSTNEVPHNKRWKPISAHTPAPVVVVKSEPRSPVLFPYVPPPPPPSWRANVTEVPPKKSSKKARRNRAPPGIQNSDISSGIPLPPDLLVSKSDGLQRNPPPAFVRESLPIVLTNAAYNPSPMVEQPKMGNYVSSSGLSQAIVPQASDSQQKETLHIKQENANLPISITDLYNSIFYPGLSAKPQEKKVIDLSLPAKPVLAMTNGQSPVTTRTCLPRQHSAQIKMKDNEGIRSMTFNLTGSLFAVICRDSTVRIWDNATRTEIAKLAHSSSVVSVEWLAGTNVIGVVSLGVNGIISKWTQKDGNKWEWSKVIDSGDDDPACLAYSEDKIAVANPRKGIKLWTYEGAGSKGQWRAVERNITRKDVIAIRFVENNSILLCGSADGSVFYCTFAERKVRTVATFRTKIFQLDYSPARNCALVAEACGRSHIIEVNGQANGEPWRVLQDFSIRDEERRKEHINHAFGAVFTANGSLVVFGSVKGKVCVWDRSSGKVRFELDNGGDVLVQAVASFDGNGERHLISGTRTGKLSWWELPDSS